jgi:hypothetical protein
VAVIAVVPVLVAVKEGIFPEPLAPRPTAVLLFVQVKVEPAGVLDNVTPATDALAQTVTFDIAFTVGLGFTVIV